MQEAPRPTPPRQRQLTVASGKQEGDDQGQITAIEDAIARRQGHPHNPMTPASTPRSRRPATPPLRHRARHPADPPTPSTSPSPRTTGGQLIGQWAAGQVRQARNHCLPNLFSDKVSRSTTTVTRASRGHGIDVARPKKNGDRPHRQVHLGWRRRLNDRPATRPATAPRTVPARHGKCLAKTGHKVVYTINEPTAVGARRAQGCGRPRRRPIDGGCAGVASARVVSWATDQQYPLKRPPRAWRHCAVARGGGSRSPTRVSTSRTPASPCHRQAGRGREGITSVEAPRSAGELR